MVWIKYPTLFTCKSPAGAKAPHHWLSLGSPSFAVVYPESESYTVMQHGQGLLFRAKNGLGTTVLRGLNQVWGLHRVWKKKKEKTVLEESSGCVSLTWYSFFYQSNKFDLLTQLCFTIMACMNSRPIGFSPGVKFSANCYKVHISPAMFGLEVWPNLLHLACLVESVGSVLWV